MVTDTQRLRDEIIAWWIDHHDNALLFNRLMQIDSTLAAQMNEALSPKRPQPKKGLKRDLLSVAEFAERGPFTEGQLRWWIFNAEQIGLSKALVRVQRRIYIDVDKFGEWIDHMNE